MSPIGWIGSYGEDVVLGPPQVSLDLIGSTVVKLRAKEKGSGDECYI